MTDQELEERFIADAAAAEKKGPVKFEVSMSVALILIGQLQLALRHPGNTGPSAKLTMKVVRDLIKKVATTDALKIGFERVFDPDYDVTRGDPHSN